MYEITFSPERALESLLFLARNLKQPTIHEVLKLRYFADKVHLSKFGFVASGDSYVAMKFGPVASETYNLIKAARGDRNKWIHPRFVELVQGSLVVENGKYITPLREANETLLSKADVECMNEALGLYGNMPFDERTELSHDSAWRLAWNQAENDDLCAGDMPVLEIAKTLANSADVLEYIGH